MPQTIQGGSKDHHLKLTFGPLGLPNGQIRWTLVGDLISVRCLDPVVSETGEEDVPDEDRDIEIERGDKMAPVADGGEFIEERTHP